MDVRREARLSGRVPLHPRRLPHDVPRPPLDHADVRGVRAARGHQRPVQVPPRAGADRSVDRLRHAGADGLRRRPPARPGRGGPRGRVDLDARRFRAPLRRHPPRRCHDVDDDQLHGVDRAGHVPRGRREAGRGVEPGRRHDAERHAQGVHRAEGMDLPARARRADRDRYDRIHVHACSAVQSGLDLGLPHP